MANVNCEACEELRQTDPNMIVNGWSDSECTSMKNDTGLVASKGHNDCQDLEDMNDCMVGNLDAEIDKYGVCDWKKFMHKFIPNLWTLESAIICAICGIWTNIHSLWSKIGDILNELSQLWQRVNNLLSEVNNLWGRSDDLCDLIDQVISPNIPAYGTLPLAGSTSRRCGSATNKVEARPDDGTLNPYTKSAQNIGIFYANMVRQKCNGGGQEMLEWIGVDTYLYKLKSGAQNGDILWKITKSEAQSVMGISDSLWTGFTQSSWTWHTTVLYDSRQSAWLKLCVAQEGLASNEMGIIFKGCGAPNDAISSDDEMSNLGAEQCKVYRHNI